MFRRIASSLPKDPVYPADLKELGYFITPKDEIRMIKDPKAYFKFFLTKNDRHNCMQREAMNEIVRKLVAKRLSSLGLEPLLLPLGATLKQPHLPVYMSSDISLKKRVIVLFYEHTQDIGVLAHRVVGGKGGINQGTVINMVKYIKSQKSSKDNDQCPAIILANMGQLRWSRRLKKAMTQTSWLAHPQKTAVEAPFRCDAEKNSIPGNRTTAEHVNYIFNKVVDEFCDPAAKIDVIGVSEGAVKFAEFMDDFNNFGKWARRVDAFAALHTHFDVSDMRNDHFAKWLDERGRAYVVSDEPMGQFVCGPKGTKHIPAHGCPCFSLNEPYYSELMLPKGYKVIVDWFNEVAADPEYTNPEFKTVTIDGEGNENDNGPRKWEDIVGGGQQWVAHDGSEKSDSGVKIVELEDVKEVDAAKKEDSPAKKVNQFNILKENIHPDSPDVPRNIQIAVRGSLEKAFAGIPNVLANAQSTGTNGVEQTKDTTAETQYDDASKEDVL